MSKNWSGSSPLHQFTAFQPQRTAILFATNEWAVVSKVPVSLRWINLCTLGRLGGFHRLMSLLGSISLIVSGSALQELWTEVFFYNLGHKYDKPQRV